MLLLPFIPIEKGFNIKLWLSLYSCFSVLGKAEASAYLLVTSSKASEKGRKPNFKTLIEFWNFQNCSGTKRPFYRTQVSLGSCLWVPVSLCHSLPPYKSFGLYFADVTLADDDTNSKMAFNRTTGRSVNLYMSL